MWREKFWKEQANQQTDVLISDNVSPKNGLLESHYYDERPNFELEQRVELPLDQNKHESHFVHLQFEQARKDARRFGRWRFELQKTTTDYLITSIPIGTDAISTHKQKIQKAHISQRVDYVQVALQFDRLL